MLPTLPFSSISRSPLLSLHLSLYLSLSVSLCLSLVLCFCLLLLHTFTQMQQVQSGACHIKRRCKVGMQWGPPLCVVMPMFNMINHGGCGSANAQFVVEDKCMFNLIVRGEEEAPVELPCLIRIRSIGGGQGGGKRGVVGRGGGGVQGRREPCNIQGSKRGGSRR
jgi:hypothetical protein